MATPRGWTHDGMKPYRHTTLGYILYIRGGYLGTTGWYWYPAYAEDEVRHRQGPYRTLREAAQAAERSRK